MDLRFFVGGSAALLLLSCQSRSPSVEVSADAASKGESAVDDTQSQVFSLSIGMGGGFTGAWQGHRVEGDGAVIRWRADPRGTPVEEKIGAVPPEGVSRLRAQVEQAPSLRGREEHPGNMSTVVEVVIGRKASRLVCPYGQEPEDVKKVMEIFREVMGGAGISHFEPPSRPAPVGEAVIPGMPEEEVSAAPPAPE